MYLIMNIRVQLLKVDHLFEGEKIGAGTTRDNL